MIVLNIVATFIGFYSKLRLSFFGLLFHTMYVIGIMGGFYIYIIIDFLLLFDERSRAGHEASRAGQYALSDSNVMIVYSLPLLVLFLLGLFSCYLLI